VKKTQYTFIPFYLFPVSTSVSRIKSDSYRCQSENLPNYIFGSLKGDRLIFINLIQNSF